MADTPILSHIFQQKNLQAISATQLLKMDTRTTEILSFKKIFSRVFELDRFKSFPLIELHATEGLKSLKQLGEGVAGVKNHTKKMLLAIGHFCIKNVLTFLI